MSEDGGWRGGAVDQRPEDTGFVGAGDEVEVEKFAEALLEGGDCGLAFDGVDWDGHPFFWWRVLPLLKAECGFLLVVVYCWELRLCLDGIVCLLLAWMAGSLVLVYRW